MQAVLLIAALSVGQEFQVGPTFVVRSAPFVPPKYTYSDHVRTARAYKSSLVVFVGCKNETEQAYDRITWYKCSTEEWFKLSGEKIRGIVVSVPRQNATWFERGRNADESLKTLAPSSTLDDIRKEIRRLEAPPARSIRSPTQIEWSFPGGRVESLGRQPFQAC